MKEYYSRHARLFLLMGSVLLGLFAVSLALVPDAPVGALFSAVPLLFLGFTLKNTPLVRLGRESIEVKGGPFSAKQYVALGEIQRVDSSNPRLIVLHTARGPVRIPAFALEDHQRREILRELGE
jgi:hypothetical protein